MSKLYNAIASCRLYSPWAGLGRTIIAIAQLTIFLFATSSTLFVPVYGQADAPACGGFRQVSLYCLGGLNPDPEVMRWIFVVVLLVVASGWRPQFTVIPQAWIAFSFNQSVSLPDGGDSVAQIITLLMIPIFICDRRKWHWGDAPTDPSRMSHGLALSAWLFIRLQVAAIYLHSGLGKIGTEAWAAGSAEYFVARDKSFGSDGVVGSILEWYTSSAIGTVSITWGTILVECLLAVLILGAARMRFVALLIATALHLGIIVTMGLWSFGLIMIGAVMVAAAPEISLIELRETTSRFREHFRRDKQLASEV